MRILWLNEHLFGFYDGRTSQRGRQVETSWVEDGALSLGICSYALVDGAEALVVDTGVSVDHGHAIRETLESRGVARITVVLSHWHLDHVAGNARSAAVRSPPAPARRKCSRYAGRRSGGHPRGVPAIRPLVISRQSCRRDAHPGCTSSKPSSTSELGHGEGQSRTADTAIFMPEATSAGLG
jgi:cyclase